MTAARPVVFGIDPGLTTGVAMYQRGSWSALQMGAEDAPSFVRGACESHRDRLPGRRLLIGMERFVEAPGRRHSTQGEAHDVVAGVQQVVRELNQDGEWVEIYLQAAADAKRLAPDMMLKLLGWHSPRQVHANDASRHVLLRLLASHPDEYLLVRDGKTRHLNRPFETDV